jgi:hypothetical protein
MKSISEKAKQLGCDKETVRKKCLKCELPCKKVGNTFIVFEPGELVQATQLPETNEHIVISTHE